MPRYSKLNLAWLVLASVNFYACSDDKPKLAWTCGAVAVPNGTATECTAVSASAVDGTTYTCNSYGDYNPDCPPPDAGGDGGTTDFNPDASTTTGGDSGGGTGDGTPDSGTGTPPPGTGGDSGTGTPPPGTGGDSGTGNPPPSGSDGGTGDGVPDSGVWTPPGHDKDGGTSGPPGGPPGHDRDSGTSGPPGTGGDGGTSGPPGAGGDGGTHDGGPPPWVCEAHGGTVTCHKPPKCDPGNHPAACGACVPEGTTDDCKPPAEGGCWVTGGGFIVDSDGNDSFGGNAMPMKAGYVRGQWEHNDHGTGNKMHGEPSYIVCRNVPNEPGPGHPNGPQHTFNINQAYFGGMGKWNGADGYWFDVMVEDHGEPGNLSSHKPGVTPDYYHLTVRKFAGQNQSGPIVYETEGPLVGGNIQLHPPNAGHPYTPGTFPPWVSWQP